VSLEPISQRLIFCKTHLHAWQCIISPIILAWKCKAECQLELPRRCQGKYRSTAVQQASILVTQGSCHRERKAHNAKTLVLLLACQSPVFFRYFKLWHPYLTCISEDSSVLLSRTSTSAAAGVNQEGHPIDRQQAEGFSPVLIVAVDPTYTEAVPGVVTQAELFSAKYVKKLPLLYHRNTDNCRDKIRRGCQQPGSRQRKFCCTHLCTALHEH